MRVVLADPPAYTPPYDRELAAALARAGADVELVTSRFRFGSVPRAEGYAARELFYPLSSRLRGNSRSDSASRRSSTRSAWRVSRSRGRTSSMCSGSARPRPTAGSSGREAPPSSPPTTSFPGGRRRRPHSGERSSTASSAWWCTRSADVDSSSTSASRPKSSESSRIRSSAPRCDHADDGATVLCLGLIRPYKGPRTRSSRSSASRAPGCSSSGDPREPLDGLPRPAGDRAEWRLGYLPDAELDARSPRRRSRSSPTAPRSTLRRASAGARRRRAGGRLRRRRPRRGGPPLRRGRVVPPGDVDALRGAPGAARRAAALEAARGARARARELTWDASAAAHLELYRELA